MRHDVRGCLLTHMACYPGKCCGAARYIFVAGSLATALPRLRRFMQSAPCKETEKHEPSHNIRCHPPLHQRHTRVRAGVFYECVVLIHELMKATAVFVPFIFPQLGQRRKREGRLDNKGSTATCKGSP